MASGNEKVLAVGAHPDDVEIMCAGTLFALGRLGCEIHVASLTLGDCGSVQHTAAQIRRIRHDEALKACGRLGAAYRHLGFDDLCIFNDDASNRRVTALLRDVNPQIVITHSPQDYMMDHETTSLLVRNACFNASIPNYQTAELTPAAPTPGIPGLFYAQPMDGTDIFGKKITPEFYVDISGGLMLQKLEMLACHESQREWLRAHHKMDEYIESTRRRSALLGQRASQISASPIAYAEAFRQHRGHAYPQENILAALLSTAVIAEPDY